MSSASRLCAWSFIVALAVLLSKFGHAEQKQQQQKVCSTGAENNSNVSYNVSYNDTELWLNCSSGDSPKGHGQALVLWLRPDGTVLCHGSQGSCLVNQRRWLTYDDSGDYVCKTAALNGTDSRTVHINVLAPPMLQADALMICHGEHKNRCSVYSEDSFQVSGTQSININASYTGEGPFRVQWYHNDKLFDCSTLKGACLGITVTSTSQTILLQSQSMKDALAISGTYRAVVSNPYGVNESLFKLQYNCQPASIPTIAHDNGTVLSLVEGSKLNTSCVIPVISQSVMYACISKNQSASLNDSINAGECVRCTKDYCDDQNFTNITINRFSDNSCPINQLLNFISDRVTLDDDGTKISCAYTTPPGLRNRVVFRSILLDVARRKSSFPVVPVVVSASVITFVLSLLCVAAVIGSRVARKRRRDSRTATIDLIAGSDQEEQCAENEPLMPQCAPMANVDSVSQYGSVSQGPCEPGINITQRDDDSPSAVVPLHD